jgi:hypothetical protein
MIALRLEAYVFNEKWNTIVEVEMLIHINNTVEPLYMYIRYRTVPVLYTTYSSLDFKFVFKLLSGIIVLKYTVNPH